MVYFRSTGSSKHEVFITSVVFFFPVSLCFFGFICFLFLFFCVCVCVLVLKLALYRRQQKATKLEPQ